MYDFHMHSDVSFDSSEKAIDMAKTALKKGLKEICFTDHKDFCKLDEGINMAFSFDYYREVYDKLKVDGLKIRRGMEFGMTPWNKKQFQKDASAYPFDFIIGSVHFVNEIDPYENQEFWKGKSHFKAYEDYLQEMIKCLKIHDDYDVVGHITYLSKARANPKKIPYNIEEHKESVDEILRIVAEKGKGIEFNTSGVDKCGDYLPPVSFLKRFKELGGEIVTVGSDAHNKERVGQYTFEATEIVKDIFGYVATFERRKPIFHK